MDEQLRHYCSVEIAADAVNYILLSIVQEIKERALARQALLHSVDGALEWTFDIVSMGNMYCQPCDYMDEDQERNICTLENYAPYMMKVERVMKQVHHDTLSIHQKTQTSVDVMSKRSYLRRKVAPSISQVVVEPIEEPIPQVALATPEPERLGTAQRALFMEEERMRVKKKLEHLEDTKDHKAARQRQKDALKEKEIKKKLMQELAKKKYTYDYDGQILVRSKQTSPSVNLLKEISYTAELPKPSVNGSEDVLQKRNVSTISNQDAISTTSKVLPSTLRRLISPSVDLYNNGGQRQTSHIPYIQLKDGVTLKEISNGQERVLIGEPSIEYNQNPSDRTRISRSEYQQLSQLNDDSLLNILNQQNGIKPPQKTLPKSKQSSQPPGPIPSPARFNSIQDMVDVTFDVEPNSFKLPKIGKNVYAKHQYLLQMRRRAKRLPNKGADIIQDQLNGYIQETLQLQSQMNTLADQLQSEQVVTSKPSQHELIFRTNHSDTKPSTNRLNKSMDFINYSSDKSYALKMLEVDT